MLRKPWSAKLPVVFGLTPSIDSYDRKYHISSLQFTSLYQTQARTTTAKSWYAYRLDVAAPTLLFSQIFGNAYLLRGVVKLSDNKYMPLYII